MSQTPPRPPGRPRSADPTFTMTLRLPQSLGGLMDGFLSNRQRTEPGLTRQDVIREAIVRYIAPRQWQAETARKPPSLLTYDGCRWTLPASPAKPAAHPERRADAGMSEADTGQWLTLAEIEVRTGRKLGAIRSWYQRGKKAEKLRTQKNNRGEAQVWLTAELEAELHHPSGAPASPGDAPLDDALDDARARIFELSELESDLRGELRGLGDALSDARVRQAKAEGERDLLLTQVGDARAERDRLALELAEARKPLVVRMIEALRGRGGR